jgi:hypothetical protein
MTGDFKSHQIQTNKVIVTGSFGSDTLNQLLIYNYSAQDTGTPNQGVIDATKFDTSSGIGTDVLLFISGGIGEKDVADANSITCIGGDLHVSGNLSVSGLGAGSTGIKYWLESSDNIVVPGRYQYLVQGAIIIDAGGALTADPDAQIVILP